mgnify:CR=1 FL=1
MYLQLPYAHSYYGIHLPDALPCRTLQANAWPALESLENALESRLESSLAELLQRKPSTAIRHVAIAIPDETRPTPVKTILPVLLDKLTSMLPALRSEHFSVIVCGGLHPPPDEAGLQALLPMDKLGAVNVLAHDARRSELIDYGPTSRGTPVAINAHLARADLKIVVGQVDPHQFVGFTGGAKGVVIGAGAEKTIEHNHSLLFEENARVGTLEGNPAREDMNEAGRLIGIDLALNVVLNPAKEVVDVFAGEPEHVLRQGASLCAKVYGVSLDERFDIIVASCGGYPKDITLYQAQKGLNMASQALKPGGKILLLAACEQGVGDQRYYDYVCNFQSIQDAMQDFKSRSFQMGLHKCYLFGCTLNKHEAVIHTEMDQETIANCLLTKGEAQETLNAWIANFSGTPSIGVVPYANTTYFY